MGQINTTSLTRVAEQYDPVLRKLPFLVLNETLSAMGINLLEVAGKDVMMQFQRKRGIAQPYVVTMSPDLTPSTEVGKIVERELETKECFAVLKDHIMNYKGKQILNSLDAQKVNNKLKTHPLEFLIIESKIRTIAEDIIDALFFAERDTTDKSPMGMFDGFFPKLAAEIAAGEISTGKGNMRNTDAIADPADASDTDAYDILVDFIRGAHPMLRKNGVLYLSETALFSAQDALGNLLKYKGMLEFDAFLMHLRGVTHSPNLQIVANGAFGTGSRLMLMKPRNLDLGIGTAGDESFVQIRSPYEDPNILQFWTQWENGTRIQSIHPKEFMCNQRANTSVEMSGDYIS